MKIPDALYHGSTTSNITILEPRRRFTPGNEENAPEAIYATDDPAFAAAHAFPWASIEGINLYYDEDETREGISCVHFEVPAALFERLNQPVTIYTLGSKTFTWVKEEVVGRTYRSLDAVAILSSQHFNTVTEAIEIFGGKIIRI